jgi:tetratricopeptide (TPR) repeat protein
MLDSRGLVHLRLGEFDKAIADYDASLAINPKIGWSLYGRGLAKQRKGLTAEGAADIAAATAINPRLPDEVKAHGLTP